VIHNESSIIENGIEMSFGSENTHPGIENNSNQSNQKLYDLQEFYVAELTHKEKEIKHLEKLLLNSKKLVSYHMCDCESSMPSSSVVTAEPIELDDAIKTAIPAGNIVVLQANRKVD
jgi:hypothetical protein